MHLSLKTVVVALLLSAGVAVAQESAAPSAPATSAPATTRAALPKQQADEAAPKMDARTGEVQARFSQMHERFIAQAKQGNVELLFLGDSITEGWGRNGKEAWEQRYAGKHKVANFGIGGDQTQHVLWRITNGELDGIKPKVTVLMIGTNNAKDFEPDAVARGIEKIVKELRERTGTKVLLLAIFPRGQAPSDALRVKNAQVNETISKLDDGKSVRFLDIGPKFLGPDGTLTKEIMPDLLHLSPKGYQIWADAIDPLLSEMMQ